MKQKSDTYPVVLTVAGFDGSGGAGIQADIKTISALGCYGTSVLTALPVQNTLGVAHIHPFPPDLIAQQLISLLPDIEPQAIKMGMIHTASIASIIAEQLALYPHIPVVFDPVMVSSSGHRLMEENTVQTIIDTLFPSVTLLTPNLDEAALLAHMAVETVEDMHIASRKIKNLGCQSVLLKGGHMKSDTLTTIYLAPDGSIHEFQSQKIESMNTRGTGCTLSAAIAAYVARGEGFLSAIKHAQDYVHQAIFHSKDLVIGKNGKGPLNHFFDLKKS